MMKSHMLHSIQPTLDTGRSMKFSLTEATLIRLRWIDPSRPPPTCPEVVQTMFDPLPIIGHGKMDITIKKTEGTFKHRALVWRTKSGTDYRF